MNRPIASLLRFAAGVAAVATLLAAPLVAQTTSTVPDRLTARIDANTRVTLHGYIAPQANAANDRGVAPDSMPLERMHLVLKRSPEQETALKTLIAQMHTPGSASYHKWLTPAQFGQQFGPSDQDVARVQAWLAQQGFQVTGVLPGKQVIEFSGNVAQLRDVFHAQIRKYAVEGAIHYATATDPQIPAALAPVVAGFAALNDFRPHMHDRVLGTATYNPTTDRATPNWTYASGQGESFVLAPGDFAVQYDLPQSATQQGQGESIAILDFSNINLSLVQQFRQMFGLPANNLPQVIIDGNDPGINGVNNIDGAANGTAVESYLDVEWAGAVAPQATIDLVIAADTATENGGLLAAQRAVYSNVAPIISSSIDVGGCEQTAGQLNSFMASLWEEAAAQGQTVIVAAGDSGSAGCDNPNSEQFATHGLGVNSWASTPYNVAVGGTDFYYSTYATGGSALGQQLANYWNLTPTQNPGTSLLQRIPEQPWNDSQYGLNAGNYYNQTGNTLIVGGSGGASSAAVCANNDFNTTTGLCASNLSGYPKPSWQTGTGTQTDKVRDLPDVSLFAADGSNYTYYPICAADGDCQAPTGGNQYQITGVGGTSAAAPAFAAIMALVDQKYGPQGQADFVLYPLKTQFPAAFHDITVGTNSMPCQSGTANCIAVSNPINVGGVIEGQLGTGSTPDYNAAAGYNLATGLGSVDASVLLANWANVHFQSTGTVLTSPTTGGTFTHGQAVTVSGSVSGGTSPTGSVSLLTDSPTPIKQSFSNLPLTSGAFSSSVYYLPGGTYNLWAQYSGDGTNAGSASAPVKITVNPEASTNSFNIVNSLSGRNGQTAINSGATVPYGTQLVLDSEIYGQTYFNTCKGPSTAPICQAYDQPTGTVVFKDNGNSIGTAVLDSNGDAETNYAFAIGAHSVTSSYAGDPGYQPSTGAAISFTVAKATPSIMVRTPSTTVDTFHILVENSSNAAILSNGVAAVTPAAAPTGTISVTSTPAGISGTFPLSAAVDPASDSVDAVAAVTSTAAPGTYALTINYSGDANYAAASGTGSVTLSTPSGLPTTITASQSGSISPTTSVSVAGVVTGKTGSPAPTGSVTFFSSGTTIGAAGITPASGADTSTFTAGLNSSSLPVGANIITLQYSGDTTYAPSTTTLNVITNTQSDFTLLTNAPNVAVAAGGSGTDTLQLTSVNGFAGGVSITCSAPTGITCGTNPGMVTLNAGGAGSSVAMVNVAPTVVNGTYPVAITAVDSSGKYVHTAGVSVIVTGSTATGPGFTLTNSGPVSVAIGNSATGTITVNPTGGFTGAVNLTCAIPNSPVGLTCSAPAAYSASTLTVNTTSATPAGTYVATITGASSLAGPPVATTTVNIVVAPVGNPTYALTNSSNGALSLTAGSSGTSTITITPSSGFTGNVALSCSVAGSGSGVGCSLSSNTAAVTGTAAVTSTLSITTTTSSAAAHFPLQRVLSGAGGAFLSLAFFFGFPGRRRRNWQTLLGLLVILVAGAGLGCGGGSSNSGSGGGTTPQSATYTVTVTGTSGSLTQSTSLTVTVSN